MTNEFKKISKETETRYVLETASAGGTSSGSVASVSMPLGGTRKRVDNLIAQEADQEKVKQKPRQGPLRTQTGGGAHKDKTKTIPRKAKHKKPVAETKPMSAREKLIRAVDRQRQKDKDARTGLSGMDHDQYQRQLQAMLDKKTAVKESVPGGTDTMNFMANAGIPKDEIGYAIMLLRKKQNNKTMNAQEQADWASYEKKLRVMLMIKKNQGVAEGSTTRGGFGGSAGQAHHEIEWLKNKIETLKPLLTKKPGVARQIRDLERQIRERELAVAYHDQGVAEEWSQKYKKSINCSHPKGFSQKAHCAGKKKHNEDVSMEMTCPDCGMCRTHGDNMMEVKQRLDARCWKGKHKEGTKIKGGIRVNNCVPNEGVAEAGLGMWGGGDDNKKSKALSDYEIARNKQKQADERARVEKRESAWWKAQYDAGKAGKDTFEFDGKTYPVKGKGVAEGQLDELFNPKSSYPIETKKIDFRDTEVSATTRDGRKITCLMRYDFRLQIKIMSIDFNVDGQMQLTGQGDATKILTTVVEAVKKQIAQINPEYLIFVADSQHQGIYSAMARRLGGDYQRMKYQDAPAIFKYYTQGINPNAVFILHNTTIEEQGLAEGSKTKFKVGDKVRFKNRTQPAQYMTITDIDSNMFDTKVKLNLVSGWWNPESLVYYSEQGVAEAKWDPWTGGDFSDTHDMNHLPGNDAEETDREEQAKLFKSMIQYYSNNALVTLALNDLYRVTLGRGYWDSVVRPDKYLATIEYQGIGTTEKLYFKSKQEAHSYAKGKRAIVTNIVKIDNQEDTSDLITLPVILGLGNHKKKWMLKFPSEDYAQKWEFKHKDAAKIQWPAGHGLAEEAGPMQARAVDANGRTQQEWMALVKSKFPNAKILQAKMIDGPCVAALPDGSQLHWKKVEQGVAEGGGMPSTVVKMKQKLAMMTPEELLARFEEVAQRTGKSVEQLARSMAWRHGYGKNSDYYWNKIQKAKADKITLNPIMGGVEHSTDDINQQGVAEGDEYNEYSDEVDMVENNLLTIIRACKALAHTLKSGENLPEWVEEKVSMSKQNMVTVAEYLQSQHAQGHIYDEDHSTMSGGYGRHARPAIDVSSKLIGNGHDDRAMEAMLPASVFAGSKKNKLGPAGQWRNKGPKKNSPARAGDLVGGAAEGYIGRLQERLDAEVDERSVSQAQAHMMAAAAHNPAFAKKVGIKTNVAKEFNRADTGKDISKLPKRVIPKKRKK